MNATQLDGTVKDFHFLEYSGTRRLAEDVERMRMLLNTPVVNVFGISYGTSVFGTYATIFSGSVGPIFILHLTISPFPDMLEYGAIRGIGENERINYLIYSCSARNVENPGSCPVSDMRQCIGDVNQLLEANDIGAGSEAQVSFVRIYIHVSSYVKPDK